MKDYKYTVSYRACLGKGADGKYHYKRFTGGSNTSKEKALEDAKRQAERWKAVHEEELTESGFECLHDLYVKYIDIKRNCLSPRTVLEYKRSAERDYPELMNLRVTEITNANVQAATNVMAATRSPKSVRNAHGLLSAVLKMFAPTIQLNTRMPQMERYTPYVPTSDDIKKLMEVVKGTELEKAILLAAFGSLRRSECCALTVDDVYEDHITVSKAIVMNENGVLVEKGPKSQAGYRDVGLPGFVIKRLRTNRADGRIIGICPKSITNNFHRYLDRAGLPHFRFHDLRHYQASILHAIGIPDHYIMERGGWSTDSTLKNIYRHTLSDVQKEMSTKICDYFAEEFSDND